MSHPLVFQLRFARSEFVRGLQGLSDEDARKRLMPSNCISWSIGHLAWQEQRYWLTRLQDKVLLPELNTQFCGGCPGHTPPLDETWQVWHTLVAAADPFLDTLLAEDLLRVQVYAPQQVEFTIGSLLLRTIYHYWYHTGENQALRQQLGHTDLPQFVGNIDDEAPYLAHS